jgi:tetratricopeptide (TPR) repeat protein
MALVLPVTDAMAIIPEGLSARQLASALTAELTELDPSRVADAVERVLERVVRDSAVDPGHLLARLARAPTDESALDDVKRLEQHLRSTGDWEHLVDIYLARVAAETEHSRRADILLDLAVMLEHDADDADRALSARLAAFTEEPSATVIDDLTRLARETGRWKDLAAALEAGSDSVATEDRRAVLRTLARIYEEELSDSEATTSCLERLRVEQPTDADTLRALDRLYAETSRPDARIDVMAALTGTVDDAAERARVYRDMARHWDDVGRRDKAAECYQWVLAYDEHDMQAHRALERLYYAEGNWPAAIEIYGRHARIETGAPCAALYAEMARIFEDRLEDASSAIDAYLRAEEAKPGDPEVIAALARLYEQREAFEDSADAYERAAQGAATPRESAERLYRAAEIARGRLGDLARAERLLERALAADPRHLPSIEATASICYRRGERDRAITLLIAAADDDAHESERERLRTYAGILCEYAEDWKRAIAIYERVLNDAPSHEPAAARLVEVYWKLERYELLAPLLSTMLEWPASHATRRVRILRLARVGRAIGNVEAARDALRELVASDPSDREALQSLADLSFESDDWAQAIELLSRVLDEYEDALPLAQCVDTHSRVGRCALALGDAETARIHLATALALDPSHRESLLASAQLDAEDPHALVADKLSLARAVTHGEKARLLTEIGDIYAGQLDDATMAREMYREALTLQPTDHILLHKCLGVVVQQQDWSQSLGMLERLIASEEDSAVRAKYLHLAAMIYSDELQQDDEAIRLLWESLADDPELSRSAEALEALLRRHDDKPATPTAIRPRSSASGTSSAVSAGRSAAARTPYARSKSPPASIATTSRATSGWRRPTPTPGPSITTGQYSVTTSCCAGTPTG